MTKNNDEKRPEIIDITKLAGVTGGCAACGNRGGQCARKKPSGQGK